MTPTAGPLRARIVPMDEGAARGLFHLVQRRPDAIAVPPLCTALLHDYCGTHKRECAALVNAVAEDIPAELLRGPGQVPNDVWFDGLVQRLVNNRVMSPDAADWAVTRWAEALGVPRPQAAAAAPGPQAAPAVSPGATGAGPKKAPAPQAPRQEPLVGKSPRPAQQPRAPTAGPRDLAALWALVAVIIAIDFCLHRPSMIRGLLVSAAGIGFYLLFLRKKDTEVRRAAPPDSPNPRVERPYKPLTKEEWEKREKDHEPS